LLRQVTVRDVAVVGSKVREDITQSFNIVAPVAVQFTGNAEPFMICAPDWAIRISAASRTSLLNVPDASTTKIH